MTSPSFAVSLVFWVLAWTLSAAADPQWTRFRDPNGCGIGEPAELSVTTFYTFLREFLPTSSHYRRPPRFAVDSGSRSAVNGSAPVAVFPSRHLAASAGWLRTTRLIEFAGFGSGLRRAARKPHSRASDSLPLVPGRLLAGRLPTAWGVVPVLEVHLVRRLPLERRVRKSRVVLLDIQPD